MELASKEKIDWTGFRERGEQPPNTLLIGFEAVNRLVPSFRIAHILRVGRALKKNNADQAGKFGGGFKVGAVVITRCSFDLLVEANRSRRAFKIKKKLLCYEVQDSRLSKEADTNLIFVKINLRRLPT